MLRGRRSERSAIDRLLEGVRAGRSGAMVVRGEPGVGKTALLEYAIDSSSGLRVVRTVGVESETEFAFAALHQLCAPWLDRLGCLPVPQRDALETAFGLGAGAAPDRFLVGLAVLSLLSGVAEKRPLLCVVDDVQWLDRASGQTLAFVARRLSRESIAMVLAGRELSEDFRAVPELVVEGLHDADACELLGSVVPWPLDEAVRERIVAEARGNPSSLLELPRRLSPAELAGGFGRPDALSLSGRIEESVLRRLEAMPEETKLLLLVAAAEPGGDPALVRRAAERLGIAGEALEPATRAELLEVGERVQFRQPAARATVYRSASPDDRRRAHRALAEAIDSDVDQDRRAWHRAQATVGADEDVGAELERSAGRAQRRGGLAAAAMLLERAAGLTLDPARRSQRALAAAQATQLAGAPDAAARLLAYAEAGPLDELGRARADLLRAHMAVGSSRGGGVPRLLLDAAKRLEPLDPGLTRETYLDALSAAVFVGRLAGRISVVDVAQAVRAAPAGPQPTRAADLLLEGVATQYIEGSVAAAPKLKRALSAFLSQDTSSDELRVLGLACATAATLWDDESWDLLATRYVRVARDAGALAVLPLALDTRISALTLAGDLGTAASLIEEQHAVTEATRTHLPPYGPLLLAAWKGREVEASELIVTTRRELAARGEETGLTMIGWASAVLYNGAGRYEDALRAAQPASRHPGDLGFSNWALVELIIAAARSGHSACAADALGRLSEMTRASGTNWALGIEARSRALLTEGSIAERLYLEAIDRLGHTRVRVELARAHLHYGEWLRRERRRLEARDHLRTAQTMIASMGIDAFAQRTARELLATGERARKRSVETREELTAQEALVARLARDGLSNPEIGTRLFISARTAEYHLHKVFAKLDITARSQLDLVLPRETTAALAV